MNLHVLSYGLGGTPSFRFFQIKDVNPVSGRTKQRRLGAPNKAMVLLQRRLVKVIRSSQNDEVRQRLLRYATSSNVGNSPGRNIEPHRENRYFYLTDFSNAYQNVTLEDLTRVLKLLPTFSDNDDEELMGFLLRFVMDRKKGGLVQGGNASQDLFNLYVGALVDETIAPILQRHGITYTRYIDDLTFSSKKPMREDVRRSIRACITGAGIWVNHLKSEVVDLKERTVVITGIGLEYGGRVFIPRAYYRKVAGFMHRVIQGKETDTQRLHGMMTLFERITNMNKVPNKTDEKLISKYREYCGH